MKYYETSFKIKDYPKEFRIKKISPVKILSIATQFGEDSLEATERIFTFALENTEVLILDKYLPVKEEGKEVYWPNDIEDNILVLQELVTYFVKNVINIVFQKSSE